MSDPNEGLGGSYMIDPVTGERTLVGRTAEPTNPVVDATPPAPAPAPVDFFTTPAPADPAVDLPPPQSEFHSADAPNPT
jgi:hypothetical protein